MFGRLKSKTASCPPGRRFRLALSLLYSGNQDHLAGGLPSAQQGHGLLGSVEWQDPGDMRLQLAGFKPVEELRVLGCE